MTDDRWCWQCDGYGIASTTEEEKRAGSMTDDRWCWQCDGYGILPISREEREAGLAPLECNVCDGAEQKERRAYDQKMREKKNDINQPKG